VVAGPLAVGAAALFLLILVERSSASPMLDLRLFRSRQFSAANAATFLIYTGLGGTFFMLPMELQLRLGYSPLASGAALLPVTAVMLLLSATMGRLSERIGPRLPMTVGPLLCAAGLWRLAGIGAGGSYAAAVLPPLLLFSLGLATTVAPLTATVLAAAPTGREGIASAINNCVARTGGLIAVAVLPAASGMAASSALSGDAFDAGFRRGLVLAAWLCVAGAGAAWAGVRTPVTAAASG